MNTIQLLSMLLLDGSHDSSICTDIGVLENASIDHTVVYLEVRCHGELIDKVLRHIMLAADATGRAISRGRIYIDALL